MYGFLPSDGDFLFKKLTQLPQHDSKRDTGWALTSLSAQTVLCEVLVVGTTCATN